VYAQSWYGWAVEKWLFDDDLGTLLGIEQVSATIPEDFALKQNYPNPFNPVTTIEFDLRQASHVTLEIYNVMGQKVTTLINDRMGPGTYRADFDASALPSGIYFYKLKAGDFSSVKKMTLTR
ncbi:MAG: T9SS type A sorting domain-containing protein, partial [Calditrichia bacterium]